MNGLRARPPIVSSQLRCGHVTHVDDKLVPIGGKNSDRQPHGLTDLIERSPEYFVDRYVAVCGETEKADLIGIGRPHRDPVTITHLLETQRFLKISGAAVSDTRRLDQLGRTLQHKLHWIE